MAAFYDRASKYDGWAETRLIDRQRESSAETLLTAIERGNILKRLEVSENDYERKILGLLRARLQTYQPCLLLTARISPVGSDLAHRVPATKLSGTTLETADTAARLPSTDTECLSAFSKKLPGHERMDSRSSVTTPHVSRCSNQLRPRTSIRRCLPMHRPVTEISSSRRKAVIPR